MQAVCYLRPTRENIARLRRELRDPRYGEYNLCARSALLMMPLCMAHMCNPLTLLLR